VPQLKKPEVVAAIRARARAGIAATVNASEAAINAAVDAAIHADLEAMQNAVTVQLQCAPSASADKELKRIANVIIDQCQLNRSALAAAALGKDGSEYLTDVLMVARRRHAIFVGIDEIGGLGRRRSATHNEYCKLRASLMEALRASTLPAAPGTPASKPLHIIVVGRVSLEAAGQLLHHPDGGAHELNQRIYLEALAVNHVEEIIDNYQLWPAAQAGRGELRHALATAVRSATAGCPRAVHDVLSTIKILKVKETVDISSKDAIGATVVDVVVALATTGEQPWVSQRLVLDDEQLSAYASLAMCSMLDIELEYFGEARLVRKERLVTRKELQTWLLDCTMNLPAMFDTSKDGKKRIPRVSAILTDGLQDQMDQIKLASFSNAASRLLPHEKGIVYAMQRGFLPHHLAGLLDPNHILPLRHLVPFLPDEHRGIHVRAASVVPHLQHCHAISNITIDHFLQIPAAAAPTVAPRTLFDPQALIDWSKNPALHSKVLLVGPRDKSPTADCYLWVPAAAQCSEDRAALESARHLLVQLHSRSIETVPGAKKPKAIGAPEVKEGIDKALTHRDVDAVLVILAHGKGRNSGANYRKVNVASSESGPLDVIIVPQDLTNAWVVDMKK
jgi:hypothetical protein